MPCARRLALRSPQRGGPCRVEFGLGLGLGLELGLELGLDLGLGLGLGVGVRAGARARVSAPARWTFPFGRSTVKVRLAAPAWV